MWKSKSKPSSKPKCGIVAVGTVSVTVVVVVLFAVAAASLDAFAAIAPVPSNDAVPSIGPERAIAIVPSIALFLAQFVLVVPASAGRRGVRCVSGCEESR